MSVSKTLLIQSLLCMSTVLGIFCERSASASCADPPRQFSSRPFSFDGLSEMAIALPDDTATLIAVELIQDELDVTWQISNRISVIDSSSGHVGSEFAVGPWPERGHLCVRVKKARPGKGMFRLRSVRDVHNKLVGTLEKLALVDSLQDQGDVARAQAYAALSLELSFAGRPDLAAQAQLSAGRLHMKALQWRKAIEVLSQAQSALISTRQMELHGWALLWLSHAYSASDLFEQAAEQNIEAIETAEKFSSLLRAEHVTNLGLMYLVLGNFEMANAWLNRAAQQAQMAGLPRMHAKALMNLGGMNTRQGNLPVALSNFEEARNIWAGLGDQQNAISTLSNMAFVASITGNLDRALSAIATALALAPDHGFQLGDLLSAQSKALAGVGDLDGAISSLIASIEQTKLTSSQTQRVWRELRLGQLYLEKGVLAEGVAKLALARDGFTALKVPYGQVLAECFLLDGNLHLGQVEAAREALVRIRTGIKALTGSMLTPLAACVEESEGKIAAAAGRYDVADAYLAEAGRLHAISGDAVQRLRVLEKRGRIALSRGRIRETLALTEQARELVGLASEQLMPGERRRQFSDSMRGLVDLQIAALLAEDTESSIVAALAASVVARKTAVAQTVDNALAPPAVLATRHRLASLLRSKEAFERSGNVGSEYAYAIAQIAATRRDLSDKTGTAVLTSALFDLKQIQAGLSDKDLLLHFHQTADQGWIWAISSQAISLHELPGETDLLPYVEAWHLALRNSGTGKSIAIARPDMTLSGLIWPAIVRDARPERLLISADRSWHRVAFSALPVPVAAFEERFVDQFDVVVLPFVSAISDLELDSGIVRVVRQRSDVELDNRLVATQREVSSIRKHWGRDRVVLAEDALNEQSSIASFMSSPAAVLHVAAHAFAHATEPALSSLLLGNLGASSVGQDKLTAIEIAGMRGIAPLVVLSACETGAGTVSPNGGPLSLSRAFFRAGARATVSTMWKVPDLAAASFSDAFYSELAKPEATIDSAFMYAQRELKRQRVWRSPGVWGAYVLSVAPVRENGS